MSFNTEMQPGVVERPAAETKGFRFNHTMLRVRDPEHSLAFYTGVLGMRLLRRLDMPEGKFSLYFLAAPAEGEMPPDDKGARTSWMFAQRGVLELTHNWGTESDPAFRYHDGNSDPRGFGHICIAVPDLEAAIRWFDANDVQYVKRPEDGSMRNIAFIKDPDGYWIEILQADRLAGLGG